MKYLIAMALMGLLAACTTNPAERMGTGGLAGAGAGAAIGCVVTAMVGCLPGAAMGAMIGGGVGGMGGLATTPPTAPYTYVAPPPPPGPYVP
jgi:hypothetical protein